MVSLSALWLPIILSTVVVFIASNIMWMALPFWHRSDYAALPDERRALDALSAAKSGQYVVPHVNWGKLTPEARAEVMKGPMAFIIVRNPAKFSFPAALASHLINLLVISTLVAYVASVALGPGAPYMGVFRIVGTAGILAYAFGSVGDSIWYGKPWSVTAKVMVDGIIYGLLTAAVFGWLWPH